MLVNFTVENYRSYHGPMTLSLVAASSDELPENLINIPERNLRLVRTAALYGPNASGKSNLLLAMNYLSDLLGSPLERDLRQTGRNRPFALDLDSATTPSFLATTFVVDTKLFEYSVRLGNGIVAEERLVAFPQQRPQTWFHRTEQGVNFSETHLKGPKQALRGIMPPDVPFLAVAAAYGHPQLEAPAAWIMTNLRNRFASSDSGYGMAGRTRVSAQRTAEMCAGDHTFRAWVEAFLAHADLGIQSLEVEVTEHKRRQPLAFHTPEGKVVREMREVSVSEHNPVFVHAGKNNTIAKLPLSDESLGTQRLFGMLVPFYDALKTGGLAIVDELTASIHPSLARELIGMFQDEKLNSRNAQLIFTTHDTTLLSSRRFRRDQIWFTEKSPQGATDLYSLHDVKGVREDDSFEKGYLRGRYGAIPFFREFDFPPPVEEVQEADGE